MNANRRHKNSLSSTEKFALWLTKRIGTMMCAYIFAFIGIGSIIGLITNNITLGLVCGAVSSYFLQLVLLPIIMVGTNLQSKHSEHLADATFEATEEIIGLLKK